MLENSQLASVNVKYVLDLAQISLYFVFFHTFLGLKLLKKIENIGNPGTRVLRLKNPTRSDGKNPGFKPGSGTRVPSL